ncbi:FYN-binding protein 1-like isoform X1 [Xyrauchen texanus]|uniref:FYN-binding protein 1-like isoform X1 n=1 Tax=Xyrauchen texanus TaxID=154827 RepID=UPI002241983C|nr:FYN-binding protein 1-like isoform X1 [Xyrauchen texanus]
MALMEKSAVLKCSEDPESEDNKSDVKAIMSRFQTGGSSMEASPRVRPKPAIKPTLSSDPSVPTKKPALETSLSGGATTTTTASKPNFLKSTVNTAKSAPDVHDPPKPKALASRFENAQENNKVNFKVPVKPKPLDCSQDCESKVSFPKVPLQKPPLNSMANDSKGTSPKPLSPTGKPPWAKEAMKSEDNSVRLNPTPPKIPSAPKPKIFTAMLQQQPEESSNAEPCARPSLVSNAKPPSFHLKNSINKPEGVKEGAKVQSANESVPKPIAPQKPRFPKKPSEPPAQTVNDDPSAPKKKPLPNSYALGSAPSKPNRPPKVNLEKFNKSMEAATEGTGPKNVAPPPPPASHPSSQAAPPLPNQPFPPSLPPRLLGPLIQDENYDDVESLRGSFGGQKNEGNESDGEIYEDLDDSRSAAESSQPQKKQDKEQGIKNQKEREKKEKEAIKKFKLSPPLQVIHQVKAKADCKGGKYDLSIKKGESIDIIRITDNPEGKWLGRTQDGSIGLVKTEMVEIDFSMLKNQSLSLPPNLGGEELYDDVGSQDDHGNTNGQRVVLPPPPDDVYDDIPDSNPISTADPKSISKQRYFLEILKSSVDWRKSQVHNNDIPPPLQFTPEGNKDISQDGEIYDDIDTLPPAPPISSLPQVKSKLTKAHDDLKKQKKFEKEEKDFRKKFKYDGEIQVLFQATIATSKKGGGKDLAVLAGEPVDVINKSDPDKFICRNKEGKFGYVSASNIHTDDEVYDDIGDDCIYDND